MAETDDGGRNFGAALALPYLESPGVERHLGRGGAAELFVS